MRPRVTVAREAGDFELARHLFADYARSLDVNLALQGYQAELLRLMDMYGPPDGALFLARSEAGEGLGCLGLRRWHSPDACELKRLFVRPSARGTGAGRALATAAIAFARGRGYRTVLLDSLPSMTAAIALYRSLGFEPVAPYRSNPFPDVLYFAKTIAA